MTLSRLWETVSLARKQGVQTPLILFSDHNPLLSYGLRRLVADAKQAGFDGMIVPDLPIEESGILGTLCDEHDMALIPLVAPTSRQRIEKIASQARGLVYCVSSLGTTGKRDRFFPDIEGFLEAVRSYSPVPTVVGFGISRSEQVRRFSRFADGVVVGSDPHRSGSPAVIGRQAPAGGGEQRGEERAGMSPQGRIKNSPVCQGN